MNFKRGVMVNEVLGYGVEIGRDLLRKNSKFWNQEKEWGKTSEFLSESGLRLLKPFQPYLQVLRNT